MSSNQPNKNKYLGYEPLEISDHQLANINGWNLHDLTLQFLKDYRSRFDHPELHRKIDELMTWMDLYAPSAYPGIPITGKERNANTI